MQNIIINKSRTTRNLIVAMVSVAIAVIGISIGIFLIEIISPLFNSMLFVQAFAIGGCLGLGFLYLIDLKFNGFARLGIFWALTIVGALILIVLIVEVYLLSLGISIMPPPEGLIVASRGH